LISDTDLLQANATIIAGVLIFLTLATIVKEPTIVLLLEKTLVMRILIFILSMLVGSTLALFVPIETWIPVPSFLIASNLFLGGLGGVVGLVIGMYALYNKIIAQSQQKEKDKGMS
jgi:hypothetical protein